MLNEWKEFQDYTGTVAYKAESKSDTTYMGRFTFGMILDFEGLARVLTIIARGYLFHGRDGSPIANPRERIDYARRALCAWCSVPNKKKAAPKEAWQFQTDFRDLREEFPELVDGEGRGWFCRHVHAVERFIKANPEAVRKSAVEKAAALGKFDNAWRKKVVQFQTPIFSKDTWGAWTLRFDDILADALELGPLRDQEIDLPPEITEKLRAVTPKEVPLEVVSALAAYYAANRQEDTDWVVLPVSNFDAYFGSTMFSRKYLQKLPREVFERDDHGFGVCRYRLRSIFSPEIWSGKSCQFNH